MTATARKGDCYKAAFDLPFMTPGATLCHGEPIGTGGDVEGIRYDHAWVEHGETVFDFSNGERLITARALYYRAGRIEAERVTRYTAEEALDAAAREMTYGPWPTDEAVVRMDEWATPGSQSDMAW